MCMHVCALAGQLALAPHAAAGRSPEKMDARLGSAHMDVHRSEEIMEGILSILICRCPLALNPGRASARRAVWHGRPCRRCYCCMHVHAPRANQLIVSRPAGTRLPGELFSFHLLDRFHSDSINFSNS